MEQPQASEAAARRVELEKEVERLSARLRREEEVRRVLEMAASSKNGSILSIPSTLPPKVKELLSELAMVEGEISRLESQIGRIQQETAETEEARRRGIESQSQASFQQSPSSSSDVDPPADDQVVQVNPPEKLAFATRPLFFLNQAIRGDSYFGVLPTFAPMKTESPGGANGIEVTGATTPNKKKLGPQLSRKTAASRPPAPVVAEKQQFLSPKLPPVHPTHESYNRSSSPRSLASLPLLPVSPKKTNPKEFHPNKLSENILKCLICIYQRLMRVSRAKEHEKLGALVRSASGPLALRNFRADGGLNLNASLLANREAKQQDPYGIFEVEGSVARDIGHYKNLVICTAASLDFKDTGACVPLLRKLRALLENLRQVNLSFSTHHQKLAFWINVYNSSVMHGFLEHGLPSHPEKILLFRTKATLNIGGHDMSASTIENSILRQQKHEQVSSKYGMDDREDINKLYRLEHTEPNVSFALCCGTKSSPALKIYTAENVAAELDRAKLEYLQASMVMTTTGKLMVPNLLVRNMNGFAKDVDSLLQWVCAQLPTSGSLRKSMVSCMRGRKQVEVNPYELDFQYLLPM